MYAALLLPTAALLAGALAACEPAVSPTPPQPGEPGEGEGEEPALPEGPEASFDLSALPGGRLLDVPWPTLLRMGADGSPDVRAWPTPDPHTDVIPVRRGFPTQAVGWCAFAGPIDPLSLPSPIESLGAWASVLLFDADPASAERGLVLPIEVSLIEVDGDPVVAARTLGGVPLHPERQYAFAWTTRITGEGGGPVQASADFVSVRGRDVPEGDLALRLAADGFQPALETLGHLGVAPEALVGLAVFTTGNPAKVLQEGAPVAMNHAQPLAQLTRVSPADIENAAEVGADTYHLLDGELLVGRHFGEDGLLALVDSVRPEQVGEAALPVRLTVPRGVPPETGWPYVVLASDPEPGWSLVDSGLGGALAVLGVVGVQADVRWADPASEPGLAIQATFDLVATVQKAGMIDMEADADAGLPGVRLDRQRAGLLGIGGAGAVAALAAASAGSLRGVVLDLEALPSAADVSPSAVLLRALASPASPLEQASLWLSRQNNAAKARHVLLVDSGEAEEPSLAAQLAAAGGLWPVKPSDADPVALELSERAALDPPVYANGRTWDPRSATTAAWIHLPGATVGATLPGGAAHARTLRFLETLLKTDDPPVVEGADVETSP